MSNDASTEGNGTAISTQSNDNAGTAHQDNAGNNAGNSTGNHSAGINHSAGTLTDFAPLMTAIAALPEQIAKSVKEAVGTPAKPTAQPTADSDSKGSSGSEGTSDKGSQGSSASKPTSGTSGTNQQPGSKSFADWWFGR